MSQGFREGKRGLVDLCKERTDSHTEIPSWIWEVVVLLDCVEEARSTEGGGRLRLESQVPVR